MRATNPHTHNVWVSCAIEDVTDLRTVCDSLSNNGTPIVCEKQEVLGACESAWQGAIGKGSVHLNQCLVLSLTAFTPKFELIKVLE